MHEIRGTTVFEDNSVSKETIMHLPLLGLHVRAHVDLSLAFLEHPVDPLRTFVYCVHNRRDFFKTAREAQLPL